MIKNLVQNKRRLIIIIICFMLFVFGMYLRYERFAPRPLNQDESSQLNRIKNSENWLGAARASRWEMPGEYLLTYVSYHLLGENKWALALPHIIITVLGFWLLYILCSRYFITVWGYLITFTLFAYNYNLNIRAFEIRPYSVLINLSLAAFLIIEYICEQRTPSLLKKIFIGLFIFSAILFHTHGIVMLFFIYLYHVIFSRKDETFSGILVRHLKHYAAPVILAFPFWCYFKFGFKLDLSASDVFKWIHCGVFPILRGVFGNLTGPQRFYPLILGIPLSLLIPHRERLKQLGFFLILVLGAVGCVLLICVIYKYWFLPKAFIWVIPLYIFMLGWFWDSIIVYFSQKIKNFKKRA